jgi:hypothetical protein
MCGECASSEEKFYGMKAILKDGLIYFEDGKVFDLNQPIEEIDDLPVQQTK